MPFSNIVASEQHFTPAKDVQLYRAASHTLEMMKIWLSIRRFLLLIVLSSDKWSRTDKKYFKDEFYYIFLMKQLLLTCSILLSIFDHKVVNGRNFREEKTITKSRGKLWDMHQYYVLFNSTRLPRTNKDQMQRLFCLGHL